MQHLNLLDARLVPPSPRPSGTLVLAVVGAALLGVALHAGIERQRLVRAIALAPEAPAEEATPSEPAHDLDELRRRVSRQRALLDAIESAQPLPRAPADTLAGVLAALPASAWLTEVEVRGAQGLRVAGGVLDASALAPMARALSQVPTLRGQPVATVRLERNETQTPTDEAASAPAPAGQRFVIASGDESSEAAR